MTDTQLRQMPAADLALLWEMLREECEGFRQEVERRKVSQVSCLCNVVAITRTLPCECGRERTAIAGGGGGDLRVRA
jgi:hypothetical protein